MYYSKKKYVHWNALRPRLKEGPDKKITRRDRPIVNVRVVC